MNRNKKVIYVIGIEGAGTSALALMYKKKNYIVLGSDNGDHFYGDILEKENIKVFDKYNSGNIPGIVDKVIYSTSIKKDNPEFLEAKKRNFKIYSYPEAVAELFNEKMGIAICGTHGKTTTSAMLAYVLREMNLDPNAIIGSKVKNWGSNALVGGGDYFIIEADEYQNKLKFYNPWSVILTSIDYDHPDFYKNFKEYKNAFVDFVRKIPKHGFLIYCNDDRDVLNVVEYGNCQKISYGFSEDSDYKISDLEVNNIQNGNFGQKFSVYHKNDFIGEFETGLVGEHNALNASSVIAFCHKIKLDISEIKKIIKKFSGTVRRFEYIGERKGAILIDDYAHHPKEIKEVLKTIKKIYSNKEIVVIFHPHSFSRTELLMDEFSQSFSDASKVIVLDIYGSVREQMGKVNSSDLVREINKHSLGEKAQYIPTIKNALSFIQDNLNKNQVIISLGAGDVWKLTHSLVKNN